MKTICKAPLLFAAMLMAPTGATAQLVSEPMDIDQYHVVEVEGAVLRIDRRTGDITECREEPSGWVCRLTPDDRAAYEAEINRLDDERRQLEADLDEARAALQRATDGAPRSVLPETREESGLPSDEDIDAVMSTAEEAMRRFFSMVRDLREELEADRSQ